MYSSIELSNGNYTTNDLPDAINVFTDFFTGEMTKDEEGQSFSSAGNGYTILLDSGLWKLQANPFSGSFLLVVGECLITGDGNLTPGDNSVEDQFEDTYTVTTSERTYIVTRKSLCVWSTEIDPENPSPGDGVLQYAESGVFSSPAWTFEDTPDSFYAEKSDLSNPTDGWGIQITVE